MIYVLTIGMGYLLGSIPFGLLLSRLAGLGDIRDIGSGNIGATNVLRTGRRDLALATLILDSTKAGLAFLIIQLLSEDRSLALMAGAAAFIGHCYPVWLGFKGGKGVATYAGLLLFSFWWQVFIIAAITWLGTFILTRISSLSALLTAITAAAGAVLLGRPVMEVALLTGLSLLAFWTHRANLQRLIKGEEPKFGEKKSQQTSPV